MRHKNIVTLLKAIRNDENPIEIEGTSGTASHTEMIGTLKKAGYTRQGLPAPISDASPYFEEGGMPNEEGPVIETWIKS